MKVLERSSDLPGGSLFGSAEPAIEGDELDIVQAKLPPAPEKIGVPTMEKGDEPLSQHQQEIDEVEEKTSAGLSYLPKFGALVVIVGLCAVFVRKGSPKVAMAGRHGAYEKSMA